MSISSLNPEDKKKKMEADKPEEQRKQEEKKRQNPKSQTGKDEKNRTKQQPDAKKAEVDEEYNESVLNTPEKLKGALDSILWPNKGKEKPENAEKIGMQKSFNDSLKKVFDKLTGAIKSLKEQTPEERKQKQNDKKSMAFMTAGKAISSIGQGISSAYNKGRNLL